jgi:hypothetical protein
MPSSHPTPAPCHWFSALGSALDPRSGPRLAWLFLGAILARGRRTVTSWIRAAGLSNEFRSCYTTVSAAGNMPPAGNTGIIATMIRVVTADYRDRVLFWVDAAATAKTLVWAWVGLGQLCLIGWGCRRIPRPGSPPRAPGASQPVVS